MTTKTFSVEGMTCASCVQTVEKATKKLSGVQESHVNLATEKFNISVDENVVSEEDMQAAVEKAGYKVGTDTENKTFAIAAMTCTSCVQSVEEATRKVGGDMSANGNLATEKMMVEYDHTVVTVSDITEAVSSAGYEAHEDEETSDSIDEEKDKKQKKVKSMWTRFWISAIFTIPLFYISMGPMVGLPLPEIIDEAANPKLFSLVQLILTIPVIILGWKFYSVGYKTLFKGHPNMDSLVARSEEHTSELQSRGHLVCRLLLEKKKIHTTYNQHIHSTP